MGSAPHGQAEFIRSVDTFIASLKVPMFGVGPTLWQPARDAYGLRVKVPLEVGGEIRPGQHLIIDAYPDRRPHEYTIGITFADLMVARLDFEPTAVHRNPPGAPVPGFVEGAHLHSWELNRSHVRLQNFHSRPPVAESFTDARQFDAVLRWFGSHYRINLGAHPVAFPPPELLL